MFRCPSRRPRYIGKGVECPARPEGAQAEVADACHEQPAAAAAVTVTATAVLSFLSNGSRRDKREHRRPGTRPIRPIGAYAPVVGNGGQKVGGCGKSGCRHCAIDCQRTEIGKSRNLQCVTGRTGNGSPGKDRLKDADIRSVRWNERHGRRISNSHASRSRPCTVIAIGVESAHAPVVGRGGSENSGIVLRVGRARQAIVVHNASKRRISCNLNLVMIKGCARWKGGIFPVEEGGNAGRQGIGGG